MRPSLTVRRTVRCLVAFTYAALCFCLLSWGSPATCEAISPDYKLWVISDLHYLADGLHDRGPAYADMIAEGDNKNVEMVASLLDALSWTLEKAASEDAAPGCLIISGDLTLNGERASHVELAARLKAIADAGIPVYVLPGNHDLDNPYARSYIGDQALKAATVSPAEFAGIYDSFGFGQALSRDEESLSYLVEPRPGLRLLLLDSTCSADNLDRGYPSAYGQLHPSTEDWIRDCARGAAADGARLVVAMHHSLVDHNSVINDGYTIDDSGEVAALLSSIGVEYVLTGHTHIQDIAEADTEGGPIYDITTGALSVFPHNYGQLSMAFGGPGSPVEYTVRNVDVAAWAKATGKTDPRLLGFDAYAESFFRDRSSSMMTRLLDSCTSDEGSCGRTALAGENRDRLIELLVRLNTRFFSGREDLNQADGSDKAADRLLGLVPDGFLAAYARSIVADTGPGDLEIKLL